MLTVQETFLSKILNKHNDRDLLRVPKPNKMKYFKCFILRNGVKTTVLYYYYNIK